LYAERSITSKGGIAMAEFMKVRMAVEKYHIGKGVFYDAIRSGELKAYKPNKRDYLLKSTEIEAWIESKVV
jgi:excisionase family DNA binding protein